MIFDVITYFMRKSSRDSSAIETIARYLFINAQIVHFQMYFQSKHNLDEKREFKSNVHFRWVQSWMSLKWFSINDLQTLLFRQIFIYATNIFRWISEIAPINRKYRKIRKRYTLLAENESRYEMSLQRHRIVEQANTHTCVLIRHCD